MKPFLSIDLTTNKKNEQQNGNEFIVKQPSATLTHSFETSMEKANETFEKSKLPLGFRIIYYLCYFTAAIMAVGILRSDVPIEEAYKNASWLFWCCGICAVIGFILWRFMAYKSKKVLEADENKQVFDNLDSIADTIYKDLGVPENAKAVDILSFYYVNNGDKIKIKTKGVQSYQFLNTEFKMFFDNQNIYLANLECLYAFPINNITSINTIKKSARLSCWNKEEDYKKGVYKNYKLVSDEYGCIHCKCYHILEIAHNNETFGIYFPSYELPSFTQATQGRVTLN